MWKTQYLYQINFLIYFYSYHFGIKFANEFLETNYISSEEMGLIHTIISFLQESGQENNELCRGRLKVDVLKKQQQQNHWLIILDSVLLIPFKYWKYNISVVHQYSIKLNFGEFCGNASPMHVWTSHRIYYETVYIQ